MYNSFTSNSAKGGNLGSCKRLADYLDKEQKNNWFNHEELDINSRYVIKEIDRYGKGQIKKHQWKFCEIEYCPSHEEIEHLIYKATGRTGLEDWEELTPEEQEEVKGYFIDFVRIAQDSQAENYNRSGINSGADLKWFAKIETIRRYRGYDEEVKQGIAKSGERKKGFHLHCHIIQSRKAMDKKTQISPLSKNKNVSKTNNIKQGFDRNRFKTQLEKDFDTLYQYKRGSWETFEFANYMKHKGQPTRYNVKEGKGFVLSKKIKLQQKRTPEENIKAIVSKWKGKTFDPTGELTSDYILNFLFIAKKGEEHRFSELVGYDIELSKILKQDQKEMQRLLNRCKEIGELKFKEKILEILQGKPKEQQEGHEEIKQIRFRR